MAALQVEWISFSRARATITAEVRRQLDADCTPSHTHSHTHTHTHSHTDRVFETLLRPFIPTQYHHDFTRNLGTMRVLVLPPLFCAVLLLASAATAAHSLHSHSLTLYPVVVTVVVLLVIVTLNMAATLRYKQAERLELKDQVCNILEHYVSQIDSYETKSRVGSFLEGDHRPKNSASESCRREELKSGHSHVSIVSVYREQIWQRLPSLLLVKGDIISLMAGDQTPGRVFELVAEPLPFPHLSYHKRPSSSVASAPGPSSTKGGSSRRTLTGWRLGRQIASGTKVLLRDDRKRYSAGSSSVPYSPQNATQGKGQPQNRTRGNSDDFHVHDEDHHDDGGQSGGPKFGGSLLTDSRSKHSRSINNESVELLTLHSDMRCFVMDETPIASFCENLLQSVSVSSTESSSTSKDVESSATAQHVYIPHQAGRGDIEHGMSYLRQQFIFLHKKSVQYCILWVVVVAIISAVRVAVVRDHSVETLGLTVMFPVINIVLVFMPISLPLGLIVAEALTTANVLATSEALIHHGLGIDDGGDKARHVSDTDSQKSSSTGKGGGGGVKNKFFKKKYMQMSGGVKGGVTSEDGDSSQDSDDECMDEYQDEDIDDRVGKVAKYARFNVSTKRQWEYFCRVMFVRLKRPTRNIIATGDNNNKQSRTKNDNEKKKQYSSLSSLNESNVEVDSGSTTPWTEPLLPIPLVRTKLVETLGAVTMVCFVDDDLVCESFSMSEEIYLLRNQGHDNSAHATTVPPTMSALDRNSSNNHNHGVVLDLHANSEASGSRFENPKWFLQLPSLKPIGLGAMVAYKNSVSLPLSIEKSTFSISPQSVKGSTTDKVQGFKQHAHTYAHPPSKKTDYPSMPSFTSPQADRADSDQGVRKKNLDSVFHISTAQRSAIEKKLIKHSKSQDPLECLRELSEEIGFEESDVEHLKNILEVSVLAPGLGDIRLVEDTHAWSQEQTRKRGSFEPHITGSVLEDCTKGSLQLMSHGFPPLLMSYCREYWDGSNISPLTDSDRKELMTIFERWDLEDFDVVAFGYSPVPVTVKQIMQPLVTEFSDKSNTEVSSSSFPKVASSKRMNSTRSTSSNTGDKLSTNLISPLLPQATVKTLVFVDPCSEFELKSAGSKGLSKLRDNSKIDDPSLSPNKNMESRIVDSNGVKCSEEITDDSGGIRQQSGLIVDGPEATSPSRETQSKLNRTDVLSVAGPPLVATNSEDTANLGVTSSNFDTTRKEGLEVCEDLRPTPVDSMSPLTPPARSHETTNKFEYDSEPCSEHITMISSGSHSISNSGSQANVFANNSIRTKCMTKPRSAGSLATILAVPLSDTALSSVDNNESARSSFVDGGDSASVDSSGNLACNSIGSISVGLMVEEDSLSVDDSASSKSLAGHALRVKKSLSLNNVSNLISATGGTVTLLEEICPNREQSIELRSPSRSESICSQTGSSFTNNGVNGGGLSSNSSTNDYRGPLSSGMTGTSDDAPTDDHVKVRGSRLNNLVSLETSPKNLIKKAMSTSHASSSATVIDPLKGKSPKALESALNRSLSEAMWPVLRQQVFLGMSASSVPIRPVINDIFEDLTQAGVRFVYFSPRNMRRSQKVAEKIGLETDWNCAISLRTLAADAEADPHRFISQYADWDVKAKLPHGIKAIKQHLKEVDNVPLLVSLFTDSTPSTITDMIDIFRDHGEVVMSLGSTYRSHNQAIYTHSDIAISVDMLPSELSQLSSSSSEVIAEYPLFHGESLSQVDLSFLFRLVGLQTCAILQAPCPLPSEQSGVPTQPVKPPKLRSKDSSPTDEANPNTNTVWKSEDMDSFSSPQNQFVPSIDLLESVGAFGQEPQTQTVKSLDDSHASGANDKDRDKRLNLRSLMEAIRTGRLFILNAQQCLGFLCVALNVTALWSVSCQAIPISIAPVISPPMLLLFVCIYIPAITISILFSPAASHSEHNVMKNTPRKNTLAIKPRDEERFWGYLLRRVSVTFFSLFVVGWIASSAPLLDSEEGLSSTAVDHNFSQDHSWTERLTTLREAKLDGSQGRAHFLHVQDVMSCQLLLSLIAHSMTLLDRGLTLAQLPFNVSKYRGYYTCILTCLGVHSVVLVLRMLSRPGGMERFVQADMYLWFAMCIFPVLEITTGVWVNGADDQMYKRYLQYLRLEFDTRLGMYSPR